MLTDQQHPITPPPELVEEWCDEWYRLKVRINTGIPEYVATQAARWGADQELEACCEWVNDDLAYDVADRLRAARRYKPPSLAEEALTKINAILGDPRKSTLKDEIEALELSRRALERLKELEEGSD